MSQKFINKLTAFLIAIAMCVAVNSNAQKTKTTHKKTYSKRGGGSYATPNTCSSTETYNGHEVFTGPRGGKYYINKNGNKTYIKH